ncbi:MAG TPA: flagellar basal-body MS-ring/collar protein FliF [Nitrospirota bacterium]|nr:flagellar basal-body MS-ring/collar protein FliF [Nitrospirota bacterium]
MAISPAELQNKITAAATTKMILAIAGVAAAIAVTIVVVLWSNQPVYHLLYSNVSAEDAATMTEKLKEQKVPYEIRDGGSIMVPQDRVHELRLMLAGQGLPTGGGVGFEIFDRTQLGMTDFVQKLNYRRAMQGELARTISELTEVEHARVHLVVPEKALFSDKKEQAGASVVLKLRGGRSLSQNQVQGIVHLVASSVEGLNPQNVTIVDTSGNVLSRPSEDPYGTHLTNYQTEYQRNLEKSFEERVQSMLERAVGSGKVVVRVSGVLDFKQVERTEEKYDPDATAVRSEQRMEEKSSGSSTTASGVPGVLSNLPGAKNENPQAAGGKGGNSSQSNKTQETINYEINKTVNHILEPVGTLKQLSAAVLIDGSYEAVKGADGKETMKYIPRTDEELRKYEEIVKKSIGYNAERGDQVEVVSIPFESNISANNEEETVAAKSSQLAALLPFIKYAVAVVAILLVFLFIVKPLMKTILSPQAGLRDLAGFTALGAPLSRLGELEAASAYPQLQVSADGKAKEEAIKIARDNPQQTAKLLKAWINES